MENDPESEIIHRELDTSAESPASELAMAVADIKSEDETGLSPIWGCIDGMLDHLFSNPPAPDAQLEVTFSYEGFRITVEQNGAARFVKTG